MLLHCCSFGCYNVAVLLLQCTVTCGRGHKTRQVTCVDALGHVVPDVECGNNKPKSYRKCRKGRCPRWITKAWSKVLRIHTHTHIHKLTHVNASTSPSASIITGRNEVVAKVMFLLVSVILSIPSIQSMSFQYASY